MSRRASLCFVVILGLTGCQAQIQHGLDERDANELISVLTARGFDAHKEAEKGKKPTWAISVEDERATDALRVLTELKLPRAARTTTREIASQSALIDTPSAEHLRQMEALEGDIEQTLETMDGVVSAGVELVVPAPARPGQVPLPSKASALLRVQAEGYERIQQQRDQLRGLIAGSVEGLHADDVALVVDIVGTHVAPVPADATPSVRLRVMVLILAVLLTAVAGVMVVMSVHIRRLTRRPSGRSTPSATPLPSSAVAPVAPAAVAGKPAMAVARSAAPKPVIAPAAQRKVA